MVTEVRPEYAATQEIWPVTGQAGVVDASVTELTTNPDQSDMRREAVSRRSDQVTPRSAKASDRLDVSYKRGAEAGQAEARSTRFGHERPRRLISQRQTAYRCTGSGAGNAATKIHSVALCRRHESCRLPALRRTTPSMVLCRDRECRPGCQRAAYAQRAQASWQVAMLKGWYGTPRGRQDSPQPDPANRNLPTDPVVLGIWLFRQCGNYQIRPVTHPLGPHVVKRDSGDQMHRRIVNKRHAGRSPADLTHFERHLGVVTVFDHVLRRRSGQRGALQAGCLTDAPACREGWTRCYRHRRYRPGSCSRLAASCIPADPILP